MDNGILDKVSMYKSIIHKGIMAKVSMYKFSMNKSSMNRVNLVRAIVDKSVVYVVVGMEVMELVQAIEVRNIIIIKIYFINLYLNEGIDKILRM